MTRGEIWLANLGGKVRPAVILTRSEVIEFRALVTLAEMTTTIRGLASEVGVDRIGAGLDRKSVVNCDGIHTVPKESLESRIGFLSDWEMRQICDALGYAFAC